MPRHSEADDVQISKLLSHALRHEPWLYELELDDQGWCPISGLLDALRRERKWADLDAPDLIRVISQSSKRRHEIEDCKIRALYGHSVPGKISKQPHPPPDQLFHGTSPEAMASIRSFGLLPMGRQYVHLSLDEFTAKQVGSRKTSNPLVLVIDSGAAHSIGVRFYKGNAHVWLADQIPTQFISVMHNS